MMRSRVFLAGLAAVLGADAVVAQVSDPTRPPGAMSAPEAAGGAAAPAQTGIQTVILRPGGKSSAVINGVHVALGDKLGDKRVVKISESEVVLKGEGGREVIKVTPDIEKVPTKKTVVAKKRHTTGTTEK